MKEFEQNSSEKFPIKLENVGSNYLKLKESKEIKHSLYNISEVLNTGLNSHMLEICIKLLETGIHPQALSEVIYKMRQELKCGIAYGGTYMR